MRSSQAMFDYIIRTYLIDGQYMVDVYEAYSGSYGDEGRVYEGQDSFDFLGDAIASGESVLATYLGKLGTHELPEYKLQRYFENV